MVKLSERIAMFKIKYENGQVVKLSDPKDLRWLITQVRRTPISLTVYKDGKEYGSLRGGYASGGLIKMGVNK